LFLKGANDANMQINRESTVVSDLFRNHLWFKKIHFFQGVRAAKIK